MYLAYDYAGYENKKLRTHEPMIFYQTMKTGIHKLKYFYSASMSNEHIHLCLRIIN